MRFALPKLVSGITRALFLEEAPAIVADYLAYDEQEFVATWPLPAEEAEAVRGAARAAAPCAD